MIRQRMLRHLHPSEKLFHSRIQLPEFLIARLILLHQHRIRLNGVNNMHQLLTCRLHTLIFPAAHCRKDRSAISRSLSLSMRSSLRFKTAAKNLLPQRAFCTAAADLGAFDPDAQTARHLEGIPEAERYAF